MTTRSPALERVKAEGPPSTEVVIRQAQRRRRRRWGIGIAGVVLAALLTAAGSGAFGNTGTHRGSSSAHPGQGDAISTTWRADGVTVFAHTVPTDSPLFGPTTTISCAGTEARTCYVTVHANGILPNGQPTTPGVDSSGLSTPFVSTEFRSTDGGRSWHALALPDRAWAASAFSCPNRMTCAVGARVGPRTHGTAVVLTTTDAGMSWSIHRLSSAVVSVRKLDCTTPSDCVALTWRSATPVDGLLAQSLAEQVFPSEILSTHDDWLTWSVLKLPPAPARDVYTLSVTCPTSKFCVLWGSRVHLRPVAGVDTPAGRRALYERSPGVPVILTIDPELRISAPEFRAAGSISCVSATRCMMVVPEDRGSSSFYESTDRARTWHRVLAHGLDPSGMTWTLQCVSASSCLTIVSARVTDDGGLRWTRTLRLNAASCAPSGRCVGLKGVGFRVQPRPPETRTEVPATRVVTNAPA